MAIEGVIPDGISDKRRRLRAVRYRLSGVPPADEKRLAADEVLVEIAKSLGSKAIEAMQRRHRLTPIQSQKLKLTGTTVFRFRIADKRTVAAVVRELEADANVASAQPNYVFTLRQDQAGKSGNQREFSELSSKQSHPQPGGTATPGVAMGSSIDSPGAGSQPPDASSVTPDEHTGSIAGLSVRDGRLTIETASALNPAGQAVDPERSGTERRTFDVLKALDVASTQDARAISQGLAGPVDPAINRSLEAARKRDMGLVAAGGANPKSAQPDPIADPILQQ